MAPATDAAPIAVIGLACRLPHAPDPAAFWRFLNLGESAITTMPADRGRTGPASGGDGTSRTWPGGFLDDVASFDAEFFGISPREAVAMDPQQRLMLELTWEALEDAGIRPASLAGSDTGVFAGAIWDDYAALLRRSASGGARHAMTGVHRSIMVNRVSHRYDLRGPSLHLDTAQSSSLVAVHVASESLRRGECSLALAGGVNLILGEDSMEMSAEFGGLSPDGRCFTFDARANGFVRGEGGGLVLLKPLDAAVRDGDHVYCVIHGGAVNNDGNTDALTVPSSAAQERVLRRAYHAAGVSPEDVQYVELHGSGTPVGDPVEAAALGAVLGSCRPAGAPLPVGSVKTNIGHLEGAGGIAGLIKTALSLRNGQLPPSLNFSTPNPDIPLDRLGLRVQDELTGWPLPDRPLFAGVSSFGMGGTNCHLVLGQAPQPAEGDDRPVETETADVPWPLSGTSPAALAAQARRLRRHLTEHPDLDPVDVGYSLATTRSAFTHRAVVFGDDIGERLERLAALERGAEADGLVQSGAADGDAHTLAERYVAGADVDWDQVFADRRCRRVGLPTYPFQRSRHWPEAVPAPEAVHEPAPAPSSSHPVVSPPAEDSPFFRHLASLNEADRDRLLLETVRASAAEVMGHDSPAAVDPGLTFKQLGFDSIGNTELAERLGAEIRLPLPRTLAFDHPTPAAVAEHLRDRALRTRATAPERVAPVTGDDPIVIVGMACQYPGGVDSPEDLWGLVSDGVDAVGEFPANRDWDLTELFDPDPGRSGRSYATEGGFLHDADLFDAGFFGISPREAAAMDPQQRLLLETAWQAFERAGIDAGSLRHSRTGVFVGATTQDYGPRMHEATEEADGQLLTGTTPSVMAGRLAFSFGLEGPTMTVDTACSSSLVAMHLACQSLRQGECSLALAGGVTVMATPGIFVEFSRQRGLAPDGRCKAFSAAADGTGWAEGLGLVILERQSDAERNGRRILAVIRGSAINQDGASNGLTAPNGPAQERVIRLALANAGLAAADVDVIEAHGTGTTLGDPIEANALLATYGQGRPDDRPAWLGTVKSNIGHTQAAAGVAGVIKMVMALRHGTLPATLHVDEPTPHVDWSAGEVRLLTEPVRWPRAGHPRRAAVSSFGISGTNSHMILEQAPDHRGPHPSAAPWVVSAKSARALRAQARRLAEHVTADPDLTPAEVGWSLIKTRSKLEHRAAVIGRDRDRLLDGLAALAEGAPDADVVTGVAGASGARPVLVFPGQGSQWVGMGAELLESSPVFAARVGDCERALAPHVDWSLTEVLRGGDLERVDVVQPALWAVMVSLAAVWEECGVTPAAVIGHSQGEIAAACVAGALSIEDAARVVAVRSRALRRLSGQGAMASLRMSEAEAGRLLAPAGDVTVAAVNGPASTVISGPPERVAAVVSAAREDGLRARMIDVDYASHGPQVDRIADELGEALSGVAPATAQVPFYSTVTGQRSDAALHAGYWVSNLRHPVRFADTVQTLLDDGHRVFIEASPNPVLTPGIEECAEEAGERAVALGTIRRDDGGHDQLVRALAGAFTAGVGVDWTRCLPADPPPRVVDLPTYAFERERYWLSGESEVTDAADLGLGSTGHPMLGAAVEPAGCDDHVLTGRVSRRRQPWLADHLIAGTLLVPGAAQLEWALRAADQAGCAAVEELVVHTPLAVPEPGGLSVQVKVGEVRDDGRREVGVYSRSGAAWTRHAGGMLRATSLPPGEPPGEWPPAGAEPVDLAGFYDRSAAAGYGYGPAFQGLRAMWRAGSEVFAEIDLPEAAQDRDGFGVHPALLDAALHPLLAGRCDDGGVWLPFVWNDVALHAVGATSVRVRLSELGHGLDQGVRLTVTDPAGGPVLDAEVTLLMADEERLRAAVDQAKAAPSGGAVRHRPVASTADGQDADLAGRLAALAEEERRRLVLDLVRGHSAAVLGYADPAEVRPDATFTELGLASVMAVELRDRLVSATAVMLPAALVFGHPTPQDVADELLRRLASGGAAARRGRAAGPLLGEVARLESALSAADVDESDVGAVTARLEQLLEMWKRARRTADEEDADAADRLKSASAEQVLDFINNDLGVS
ncbi:beta-ketoacyl synthase N-terminal-like domain-containing protein [Spirillospora sp. NPDC048911]|uniref:beta-ketoacyl synthase N-terminal-like domain-containing protein n=1 Tax=Spirillospora sp. NPDC048911 TaxID=3364527 RepID=UPI00371B2CEE